MNLHFVDTTVYVNIAFACIILKGKYRSGVQQAAVSCQYSCGGVLYITAKSSFYVATATYTFVRLLSLWQN